ncbi:MAG TPA: hypothetical protein VGO93_26155, partial [Candidatus Xenobia bacterium]
MSRLSPTLLAVGLAAMASCLPAQADAPAASASPTPTPTPTVSPISTNRPTFGTYTGVVGPRMFQVESGVSEETFKGGGTSLFQVVTQFRYGTGNNTEIAFTNPLVNVQGGNAGIGDSSVYLKWDVGHYRMPAGTSVIAVIPTLTIPTGAAAFRNAGDIGEVIISNDIPTGKNGQILGLNVAPASAVDPANGRRFGQFFYSAGEVIPVGGATYTWLEIAGFGPDASV